MNQIAGLLPERPPRVGELVEVRSRRWLVEAVETPAPPASPRVALACADDDAQGRTLEVWWDFEIDRRILEQEAWSAIGARGFDPPRHFGAFLHTLRWNCVTATDPNLFQSPFRAGIRIDAYQVEPLRKALRLPRVNLFIADDTGLGKTIEAGLIARELLLRKKVRTIVVAAPASVLEQWKAEMEERFGLLFVILDRARLARVRQERGFGVNPWRTHSRFLVSHNLLIDPAWADPMREWLGEMRPGSLLILDEAHHAAPSSGGRYGIETKFTRAIRDLGGRFEHRLFLSATPHNGHSNSFSTLLELLDPYRFTRGVPVRGKGALEDVMVRRIKEDVRQIQGGFPERDVRPVVIDGLPEDAPELVLSRLLDEYRSLREERLKTGTARARAAAALLVVGLQQKLLSSIEAFAISLARHRVTVRKQWERARAGEAEGSVSAVSAPTPSPPGSGSERMTDGEAEGSVSTVSAPTPSPPGSGSERMTAGEAEGETDGSGRGGALASGDRGRSRLETRPGGIAAVPDPRGNGRGADSIHADAGRFASPPGADDERAELSDGESEAEEAAQIAALDAAAEAEAAGAGARDAKAEAIRRREEVLLERMEEVASGARGLPDAKTRRLIDWIRDNLCPALPRPGGRSRHGGGTPARDASPARREDRGGQVRTEAASASGSGALPARKEAARSLPRAAAAESAGDSAQRARQATATAPAATPRWNDARVLIFTENVVGTKRYLREMLERAVAGTHLAEERIETIDGQTVGAKRKEIQRRFNADPARDPLRILIATDAAREGLNFQAHCTDLFHFDLPWNPGRIEQRNGRIDRKLQPAPRVRCHYFVLPQRAEDHVLEVLVRKTDTIKRELGSLSKVIDDDVERRLRGGIRHRDAKRLAREIEAADLDREKKRVAAEELEAARERQDDLKAQIERCRGLLERSRRWARFSPEPFRDAMSCALEMLGAAPLQEGRTGDGRPIWTFPPLAGKTRTDVHDDRGQGRPATPPRGIADLPDQHQGPAGNGSTLAGGDRGQGRPATPPSGIADLPGQGRGSAGEGSTLAGGDRGQGRPATPPSGIADLPGQGRGPAEEGSSLADDGRGQGRPATPPRGIADAPGRREDGRGADLSLASWTATLDTLRAPRKTGQKLAEWRRDAPIRPVVFEDAGVLTDDTVHLHLEQRVAQRLLARFRTQGFVHHDLSRACLVQAADSIPRVALLGRLCLFGRRAERLHEVLVPVAARWIEPSRRAGPLKAYAEEAEARTLERLEAALQDARAPGETIHRRLLETAARDVEDLLPQLEARAEAVARSAADRLRERGEREERQLREILEGQRRRVEAELRRHEGGGVQLAIEFSEEEKRQRQADVASWRTRLAWFDRDLETEPARIRGFYEVRARRVEPIGLVYLWPDTG